MWRLVNIVTVAYFKIQLQSSHDFCQSFSEEHVAAYIRYSLTFHCKKNIRYLFIYGLFNDIVNRSAYSFIASDGRVISE
jgi:hypothetical protein